MYIIIFVGIALLSFGVSYRLKSKFKKYSKIQWNANLTGKEVAEQMLRDRGVRGVQVTSVPGRLTDHYNPADKTVNLSEGGVPRALGSGSGHCGSRMRARGATRHGLQFFRVSLDDGAVQNVSARILNFAVIGLFMVGGFINGFGGGFVQLALTVIVGCYAVITLFSLVTLPVEFDASKRALAWIKEKNIASPTEYDQAQDALKWAAMTYVVAALGSIVALLYWVSILMGGRD